MSSQYESRKDQKYIPSGNEPTFKLPSVIVKKVKESPSDQEYLSANDSSHDLSQGDVDSEVLEILDTNEVSNFSMSDCDPSPSNTPNKHDQHYSDSRNYSKRKTAEKYTSENKESKKNKESGKWFVVDSTMNHEDNKSGILSTSQAHLRIKHGLKGDLLYKISGPNQNSLNKPVGVAQLPTGQVVVADTFNDRMVLFSPTGKFVKSFTSPNMKRPSAVITVSSGNFIVKDHYSIDHFDSSCNYIGPVYSSALLKNPYGLTITDQGKLITVETGTEGIIHLVIMDINAVDDIKRIMVNLKLSRREASHSKPRFIAHQTDNVALVVDLGLNCIFRIRYDVHLAQGEVCKKIGTTGNMNGQFIDPSGICVDSDEYILIGDSKNHRIQLFDPEGEFLSVLKLNVPLRRPSGMFLSPEGELLIINYWENNVAKYQLSME